MTCRRSELEEGTAPRERRPAPVPGQDRRRGHVSQDTVTRYGKRETIAACAFTCLWYSVTGTKPVTVILIRDSRRPGPTSHSSPRRRTRTPRALSRGTRPGGPLKARLKIQSSCSEPGRPASAPQRPSSGRSRRRGLGGTVIVAFPRRCRFVPSRSRGQAGAPAAPRRQARARTNELDAGKRRPIMGSEEEALPGAEGGPGKRAEGDLGNRAPVRPYPGRVPLPSLREIRPASCEFSR
jgi:hypothetical protein